MRSRAALLVVVPLLGAFAAALPASSQSPQACPERQTAHAFTADGRPAPYSGVGCTIRTGFLTSESHIRVAPDGVVVQQPAQSVPGVGGTGFGSGAPGPK